VLACGDIFTKVSVQGYLGFAVSGGKAILATKNLHSIKYEIKAHPLMTYAINLRSRGVI
jgi:hypothetical protein